MSVELVNDVTVSLIQSNASDGMVAMAAWVSNGLDDESRLTDIKQVTGLINFLWREKHTSPFEHGNITVKADVPFFVAREWHRHRTESYNEVSGRYTIMKPRFYCGTEARVQKGKMGNYHFEPGTSEQTAIYLKSKERMVNIAWEEYERRIEAGISKEQSREDLPLSMMTQFYATASPLNWLKFLSLRNESHALKEIRDAAVQVEAILAEQMPITYNAYKKAQDNVLIDLSKPRNVVEDEVKNILMTINLEYGHELTTSNS